MENSPTILMHTAAVPIAAASASVCSILAGYPFDTIKTRMQAFKYPSTLACVKETYTKEGLKSFFRGCLPVLISSSILRAFSFSLYTNGKAYALRHASYPESLGSTIRAAAISGFITGSFVSVIHAPIEFIKIQRQLELLTHSTNRISPFHISTSPFVGKSMLGWARRIIKRRGIFGLYYGSHLHVARDALGTSLYFGGYELCKKLLTPDGSVSTSLTHMISGGSACWLVVFPIDVVKSVLQKEVLLESPRYSNGLQFVKAALRKHGIARLYTGITPQLFIKSLLLTPFVLQTRPQSPGKLVITKDCSRYIQHESNEKNVERYSEILACIQDLIADHILHQKSDEGEMSRLSQLVPSVGRFFTPLLLKEAFLYCNAKRSIASRTIIPPSFNDIRHILNYAQVKAIAPCLKLITFDGDMTLYADGTDFTDSVLVGLLVKLLLHNLHVAIVTAAGYGNDNEKYEQRLCGLLDGIKTSDVLSKEQCQRFYVMGGECNFLYQLDPETWRLSYIHEDTYQPDSVKSWSQDKARIEDLLNVAQECFEEGIDRLGIRDRTLLIRKEMAVGLICIDGTLSREQLDELALTAQQQLNNFVRVQSLRRSLTSLNDPPNQNGAIVSQGKAEAIPFCAFNGGKDVWIDVGSKLIGVGILQDWLKTSGNETLHVGDQFLSTGNDISTRSACCTTWITSPKETAELLMELVPMLQKNP